MAFTTLEDALRERMRLATLRKYPGGVVGTHSDNGEMPVHQHEWHIDHAPTLEEVLKHKTPRIVPIPRSIAIRHGRYRFETDT